MFSNSFKLGIAGLTAVALVGCDNPFSKDSGGNNAVADRAAADAVTDYTRGTARQIFNVVSMSVLAADGSDATAEHLNEVFAKYPELAGWVAELDAVDTVTETAEGFLELNGADGMSIALKMNAGSDLTVAHSRDGFRAESISYSGASEDQAQGGGQLRFALRSCAVPEMDQDQEQGQTPAPEKGQDVPDKGQDQGQEKGQDIPDKGQDVPDKGQDKVEDCASLTVILDLNAPEQKQEQGKDQAEDKGQDKGGKTAPGEGTGPSAHTGR